MRMADTADSAVLLNDRQIESKSSSGRVASFCLIARMCFLTAVVHLTHPCDPFIGLSFQVYSA
jgi:hypothetical protein